MGLRGYKLETGLAQFLAASNLDPVQPKPLPTAWLRVQRLTAEQANDLVNRYEAGTTSRELAEQFSISKTSVVRLLRSRGVSIRRRGPGDQVVVWSGDR